jgi:hypothetical protein
LIVCESVYIIWGEILLLSVSTTCIGSNGVKKMENIFRKANKVYIKGGKTNGLLEALNIKKIMKEICSEIKPLCKGLGVKCEGDICNMNEN